MNASCFRFEPLIDRSELEKLHTKQLLKRLHTTHRACFEYAEVSDECKQCLCNCRANYETMKSILAHREHIPNKQESRANRKARIKRGI